MVFLHIQLRRRAHTKAHEDQLRAETHALRVLACLRDGRRRHDAPRPSLRTNRRLLRETHRVFRLVHEQ